MIHSVSQKEHLSFYSGLVLLLVHGQSITAQAVCTFKEKEHLKTHTYGRRSDSYTQISAASQNISQNLHYYSKPSVPVLLSLVVCSDSQPEVLVCPKGPISFLYESLLSLENHSTQKI